jgi:hypothetical protein
MDGAEIVSVAFHDVISRRSRLLTLAARQRAKFEGWLKFELANTLAQQREIDSVDLEYRYPTGGNSDLSFRLGSERWYVELKTANTNWRAQGVRDRIRPITGNVDAIIHDIIKLREGCPPDNGMVAFVFFPVPLRIWDNERYLLEYHLQRIEQEGSLHPGFVTSDVEFLRLEKDLGLVYFVGQVV